MGRRIVHCLTHPHYKANQKPRQECETCQRVYERSKLAWRMTMKKRRKTFSSDRGKCNVCAGENVLLVVGTTRCVECETRFQFIDIQAESRKGIRYDMCVAGIPLNMINVEG